MRSVEKEIPGITSPAARFVQQRRYDEQIRYFWVLHTQVEVGHSNGIFNAIFPHASAEETKRLFEAGIEEFLRLLEAYWDRIDALIRT
jgi:hypothetical protein